MKTVTLDIDGVLNNYPTCWLDFIELEGHPKFKTIAEAKKKLGHDEYILIKEKYRISGYKSTLPVNPLAPNFTKLLKEKGFRIVVATSRPFHKYPHLEQLTFDWLKKNEIQFDVLEKKDTTLIEKYQPVFHVDDELEHVLFFLENKTKVFIIKRNDIDYTGSEKFHSLQFISQLDELLTYI